jgi:DNA-binding MarR family transcriptional regulator
VTETQSVLDSIRSLFRLLRLSDRAAQTKVGLSAAQLFVLSEVGKTPEISLGEIAERTRTDQSSVSTVVTRLVDGGLITRERAGDDARRLALSLTAAGRAALRKAPPVAQEVLIEIVDRLPAAERRRFAETFARVVGELGVPAGEAPPMLFEEEPRRKKGARR